MRIILLLQSYAVDAVAHGCDAENQTELVETDVLTVGIERLRARLFGREPLEPPCVNGNGSRRVPRRS